MPEFNGPFKKWPEFVGYEEGVRALEEFDKAIGALQRHSDFVDARFRGEHRYYTTYLTPKIGRYLKRFTPIRTGCILTKEELCEIRKTQIRFFYKLLSVRPYEVQWLSIAQHYGFKTRLLDITRNKYVGLFYACFDERNRIPWDSSCHGYTFLVPPNSYRAMSKLKETVRPRDIEQGISANIETFFEPSAISPTNLNVGHLYSPLVRDKEYNARLKSQEGEFIWWHPIGAQFPQQVFPIRVNKDAKRSLLKELCNIGFSPEKLYPDGYGRNLQRKLSKA